MAKEKLVTITYNGYRSQHNKLAAIAENRDVPIPLSQLYREMIAEYVKKHEQRSNTK